MKLDAKYGVCGAQNLEVLKNGKVVRETGFHHNLVLDAHFTRLSGGLNASAALQGCKVGTGTTAPTVTQTDLVNSIGFKAGADSAVDTYLGVVDNNHVYKYQRIWTFAEGAVIGNVSEVATSAGSASAATPISTRALVLDPSEQPTSITVNADEQLRITHDMFLYIPAGRSSALFSVTTGGNTTQHLAEWEYANKTIHNLSKFLFGNLFVAGSSSFHLRLTTSTLDFSPTQDSPTTTGNTTSNTGIASTQLSPLVFESTGLFSSTQGNAVGGVGGAMNSSANASTIFAFKFTPPIPKTTLSKLTTKLVTTFVRM